MNEKIFSEAMLLAGEQNQEEGFNSRQKVRMAVRGGKEITFMPLAAKFGGHNCRAGDRNWRIENGTLITDDGLYLVVSEVIALTNAHLWKRGL